MGQPCKYKQYILKSPSPVVNARILSVASDSPRARVSSVRAVISSHVQNVPSPGRTRGSGCSLSSSLSPGSRGYQEGSADSHNDRRTGTWIGYVIAVTVEFFCIPFLWKLSATTQNIIFNIKKIRRQDGNMKSSDIISIYIDFFIEITVCGTNK